MSDASTSLEISDNPQSQGEYEIELERWFRRRFAWLCVAFVAIVALEGVLRVVSFLTDVAGASPLHPIEDRFTGQFVTFLSSAAILIIALHFYLFVRPKIERREQAVGAATNLILALGATTFAFQLVMLLLFKRAPVPPIVSITRSAAGSRARSRAFVRSSRGAMTSAWRFAWRIATPIGSKRCRWDSRWRQMPRPTTPNPRSATRRATAGRSWAKRV